MGLAALWHVGSSQARAWTCVSCIGRRILNHCATREVPKFLIIILILGLGASLDPEPHRHSTMKYLKFLWQMTSWPILFLVYDQLLHRQFLFASICLLHKLWTFFSFLFLFLAALGLHCCVQAFSSCGKRGLLFVAVHGLLIAVASLVAEHGL